MCLSYHKYAYALVFEESIIDRDNQDSDRFVRPFDVYTVSR